MRVAERLGFTVRATKGNFRGGRCTVDGTPTIVLNTRHLPETRLRVLARALRGAPLHTVYLKPSVRDALHDAWADMGLRIAAADIGSEEARPAARGTGGAPGASDASVQPTGGSHGST